MHISFGIQGVNRDGFSFWDSEEYGVVVWDDTFDMSSSESQEYLVTICEQTRASELVYRSDLVDCPIMDFKYYLNVTGESFPYVASDSSSGKSFEEMYYDFLKSDIGANTANNALSYIELTDDGEYIQRFYAMYCYTILQWTDPAPQSRDGRDEWDDWIEEFSLGCPNKLCNSVRNVALRWCWLVSQQAFVRSAIQGIFFIFFFFHFFYA